VQADYLADDAEQETIDRFFEAYLLWLFRFVLFCRSQGDAVTRHLIPHARRIADAAFDVVPQISWGNSVLVSAYRGMCSGVSKGRAAEPILLGFPLLLQLWCHERFAIGRPVVPLYVYKPLPEGHDPRDCFTMGSLWCLRKVITYLSLSICVSISSSLFNRHLWFTFGLYADIVRPRLDEEGVQGLRRAVRCSHGCGRQVDAVLRGGCRGPRITGPLNFVLPRPAVLDDEVAIVVRHVRGVVRRPQGAEAVRPLPEVACACGAHCFERPP
jgi:hypothetical protein